MHIKADVYMRSGVCEGDEVHWPQTFFFFLDRQISYTHLLFYALKKRGFTFEKDEVHCAHARSHSTRTHTHHTRTHTHTYTHPYTCALTHLHTHVHTHTHTYTHANHDERERVYVWKETYIRMQIEVYIWEKRSINIWKETYVYMEKDIYVSRHKVDK